MKEENRNITLHLHYLPTVLKWATVLKWPTQDTYHYNDREMFKASPKRVQTLVFAGIAVANTTIITAEQTMKKSLNSVNYSVMKTEAEIQRLSHWQK